MTRLFIASECHSEVYIEKRVMADKGITRKIHYDGIIKCCAQEAGGLIRVLEEKSQEVVGFWIDTA